MRYFSMLLASLFLVLFSCQATVAQNDNDPFAETKSQKQAIETTKEAARQAAVANELARQTALDAMDKAQLRARMEQQRNELTAKLNQTVKQLHELKATVVDARQTIAELNKQLAVTQKTNQAGQQMQSRFLSRLLASKETSEQLLALEYLLACYDESIESGTQAAPLTNGLLKDIRSLLGSKNEEVQEKAKWSMLTFFPATALEEGYQVASGYWWPVSRNQGQRVYRLLQRTIDLEYEQVPLIEIFEDLQMQYGIEVAMADKIDQEKLVDLKIRNAALCEALEVFLTQQGLTYRCSENGLTIYTAENRRAKHVETYCIRGLLTEDFSLEDLIEFAKDASGDDAKINRLDSKRIMVIADSIVQFRIAKALGSIAK